MYKETSLQCARAIVVRKVTHSTILKKIGIEILQDLIETHLLYLLYTWRIFNLDDIYSKDFYVERYPWQDDAKLFVSVLINELRPADVIDFGCGNGLHINEFLENHIEAFGVDGSKNAKLCAVCPPERIKIWDLRFPFVPRKKYDLALCIETAEHISEQYAHVLVKTLTTASDRLIFSAAAPGESGRLHVNLKPQRHWIRLIEDHGLRYEPEKTKKIRQRLRELKHMWWIKRDLMYFQR